MSQSDHAYYLAHRDEILTRQRTYGEAHREERAQYDRQYRTARRERRVEYMKQRAAAYQEWLHALNATWSCDSCGGPVDAWHHLDPATKLFNLSWGAGRLIDAIQEELEKCVPLCKPCHSRLHAREARK